MKLEKNQRKVTENNIKNCLSNSCFIIVNTCLSTADTI